jgi:pimeloyl-ACP methyl ester carboxylesterase
MDNVLRHATLNDMLREQVIQDSLAGSSAAVHDWPTSTALEDVSTDLAAIDVPVLVVAGQHDQVEPVEILRSHVLTQIPHAQLEIIPDSGHLIPLEQPDQLGNHIVAFRDTITHAHQ